MIITRTERVEDAYGAPSTSNDDEMRLLHELGICGVFEVTEVALQDRKVFGTASFRLERERGDGYALYVLRALQSE